MPASPPLPERPARLPPETVWTGDAEEQALEGRLRAFALPAALFIAFALVRRGFGHFLLRTFVSMWVHETGHAATAWLCGFPAFPGPWFTPVAEARSPLFAVVLAAALAFAGQRSLAAGRRGLAAAVGVLLLAQLVCTLLLRLPAAHALVYFGGDAGCLVLGTLCMITLYSRPGSTFHRGALRYGFVAIGACAFADAFEQWWAARTDPDRIPFGRNEGMGLSDPSTLADVFGWSETQIVGRYVALGCVCLAVLAAVYWWGLRGPRED
ncbi:MAG: hypothetical protein NVS2B9_06720 [Myxococcales bacterium]